MNKNVTNKLEEAIESLPKATTCFLLELDTNLRLTKAIGELLKERRPFCVLLSIKDYYNEASKHVLNQDIVKYSYKLDDYIILVNTTTDHFIKTNQTYFNLIFAPDGISATPMKKFLTDNGDIVVISQGELGW